MADIIRYTGGETITATVANMVSGNADAYWYTGSNAPSGASYIINGIYDDNDSSTSTDFAYKTNLARLTGNTLTNTFKTAANIFDDTNKRYPKYVMSFIKFKPKYASGNYGNDVKSTNYVEVRQKVNSVTITSSNNKTYGNAAFTISYTVAPSNAYVGNMVSFSKQSGSSVNLSGTANKTVTIVGAGTSTIKYTSADGKCTGTFNIVVAKATPTITMADTTFTFTGSRQYMTATVNVSGTIYETYNGSEPSTTNYNSKYSVTANTAFNIDSATNVGNWTIKALFVPTDTNNYNNASKSNTLKMNARNLSDVTVTWGTTTFEYNGSAKTVTPTLKYGSITLVSGTDYTISNNSRTSAGSQTVTVTGKGNYTGTKTTTLTVNKAASSMTNPGPKSVTYGGRTTTVTISCTNCSVASATSSGSAITVSSSGNTLTLTSNSISNAGSTATITVTGTGNANYNNPQTITFTASIVKATPSYTAPSNNAPTYTGEKVQIIKAGSTSHGKFYYNTSASDDGATEDISASALKATSAGSYTRYWKLVGDANHNNIGWTAITCTVGKKTSTVKAPTGRTVTYNGSAQALANAGSCTGGKIQYCLTSTGTYSDSIPTGTNYTTGTTVYWKAVLTDTTNYALPSSGISGSVTGIINKATSSMANPGAKSVTYGGSTTSVTISCTNCSVSNVTSSSSVITVNRSGNTVTLTSNGNAGTTATITVTGTGNANYNNPTSITFTATVGKQTSTVKEPTGRTVNYNGSAQALANAGSCTGGKIQYCLTSTGIYSDSIPTATNYTAGTTVYWGAVITDSNYALPSSGTTGSVIGKINKVAATKTNPTAKSGLVYNGYPKDLINAGSTSHGTFYYNTTNTDNEKTTDASASALSATNAGSYTRYWKFVTDINHTGDIGWTAISCSIAKANQSAPTATGKTTTYPTVATATASGGGGQGTIEWSNGSSRSTAGTTSTQARWSGNSNYNASPYSSSVNLVVNKATPSVTFDSWSKTYNGSSQNYTGKSSVSGTLYMTWNGTTLTSSNYSTAAQKTVSITTTTTTIDSDTNAGSWTYKFYFVPTDTTNYNACTPTTQTMIMNARNLSDVTVTWGTTTFDYNGSTKTVTPTLKYGSITLVSGTDYTVSNNSRTSAGSQTVTVTGKGNYTGTKTTTLTVNKVAATKTNPTARTVVYTGSAQQLLNAGSTNHGTFYYNTTNASSSGQTTDVSNSYLKSTNAGTVTRYWRFEPDGNHTGSVDWTAVSCTINPRNLSDVTVTWGTTTFDYNDSTRTVTPTLKYGSITLVSGTDYTVSNNSRTSAGSQTVTVTGKGNYTGTKTTTLTVNKASSSMANPGTKYVTYGGSTTSVTISCTNCSVSNVTSSSSVITVTRSGNTLTLTSAGNAGTSATITVTGTGNANYNNPTTITFTATVAKKTSTITAPTGRTVNYNGSAQALANAGSCIGGKIQYCLTSTGIYSDSIPTATNYTAGTTVYWGAVITDSNYALPSSGTTGSVIGKINKVAATKTNPTAKEGLVYTGSAQQLLNAGSSSHGTFYYDTSASGTVTTNDVTSSSLKATNAGSWTRYWKFVADINHTGDVGWTAINGTIGKANQSAPTATGKTTTYPTVATATASGGGGQGKIEWSNGSSRSTAGTTTTKARWSGNSNYNASPYSSAVNLVVNKATPTATISNTTVTYNGSTQYFTVKTSVPGKIYRTWDGTTPTTSSYNAVVNVSNANTATNVGSASTPGSWPIKWLFVPTDTTNYNNVSGSFTFIMNARNLSDVTVTWGTTTFDYNGGARTVTPTLKYGSITLVSGTDYTVSNNSRTSAGSQTVTVTGKGNYTGTKTTTLTVNKVAPSYTAPSNNAPTYTGSSVQIIKAGSTSHGTLYYNTTNSDTGQTTDVTSSSLKATNAGSYTRYWKLVGDANHNSIGWTAISCSIGKASSSMTNPGNKSVTYGGSTTTVTIPCTNCYVSGFSSSNTNAVSVTRSGNTLTLKSVGAAGTSATITVIGLGNTNYNDPSIITFIATVGKQTSSVTAPTGRTVNYNGSAQALANAGSCTGGKIQYSLASGGTYSDSIPTGTNYTSGTTVYWKAVITDSNYALPSSGISGSVIGKINKIASSMTNPGNKSVTYSSSATVTISCTNCSVSGASSSNSNAIEVTRVGNELRLRAVGNAGSTATITVTGTGSTNYNNPSNITFTATVAKAAAVKTNPTTKSGLVYTGNAQQLINAGSSNHGTFYYSVGSSGSNSTTDASNSGLKATSANTHTRYWKFVADSNHTGDVTWTAISCTIAKKTSTVTAPTGKTNTYTCSAQALANAGSCTGGKIQYCLTSNGTYSDSIPTATNYTAGTTVYWKAVLTDSNYALPSSGISGSITGILNARNLSDVTVNWGTTTFDYDGVYKMVTPTLKYGSMTLKEGTDYTISDRYRTDAGTTKVTVTGKGNYTGTLTTILTVNKVAAVKTNPKAKSGLVYTGSLQQVINPGSSDHGTFYYATSSAGTNSTTDASAASLKASSAKSHIRYWKFVADRNHTGDVNWTSITCPISKANQNPPTALGDNRIYPDVAYAVAEAGGGHGPLGWTNGYTLDKVGYLDTEAYWTGDSNYNRSPNSNTVRITVSYYGSYYG